MFTLKDALLEVFLCPFLLVAKGQNIKIYNLRIKFQNISLLKFSL
jgi:hypothetical protein